MCEICDKDIPNKKYEKSKDDLLIIKAIVSNCSRKSAFHFNKRTPVFDKGNLSMQ